MLSRYNNPDHQCPATPTLCVNTFDNPTKSATITRQQSMKQGADTFTDRLHQGDKRWTIWIPFYRCSRPWYFGQSEGNGGNSGWSYWTCATGKPRVLYQMDEQNFDIPSLPHWDKVRMKKSKCMSYYLFVFNTFIVLFFRNSKNIGYKKLGIWINVMSLNGLGVFLFLCWRTTDLITSRTIGVRRTRWTR